MANKSNEISTIAKNIKKARNKKGISQGRLSKIADVIYNTMAQIANASGVKANGLIKK